MFEYFKRLLGQNTTKKEKPLNLYQYKFIRFKEERDKNCPLDLTKVHVPFEKGLISVVLPVYNGADLVSLSIDSVLKQTYKNFELIIINDGSKDNTKEIIEEYAKKDSRITVINQENRRIPRTLSRGFSLAKGEYFTWTSADNIMPEYFLEKMMGELERNRYAGMVFGNMRLINEKGKKYKNHGWFEIPMGSGNVIFPENTYELNTYANNTIGAAFMYRKKAFEVLGCYSSFKHTLEDYDYWMRMNSLFKIIHTSFKEPVYLYRWHSGSLTAKDKELGITKNRYKLMLLDDARRDFYLSPLLWYLKADESSAGAMESFKAELLKRGHMVIEKDDLGRLFFGKEARNFAAVAFGDAKLDEFLPSGTKKLHYALNNEETPDECEFSVMLGDEAAENTGEKKKYVFSDIQAMVSFLDARIKNDLLYKLEEKIESEKNYTKKLSFILCTHRISKVLYECMEALISQDAPKEDYEIVFVNNNFKDDKIKEFVLEAGKNHPDVTINYITAPFPGLSNARNAGLWEANGEIVHYIDDDAVADLSLARECIRAFSEHKEAGVIGGNIILEIPEGCSEAVTEITRPLWSELLIEGDKYRAAKDYGDFPYGANFAARTQTLMQIGGFRTMYGRVGNNYAGGEETLVCFMTEETGQKIGLEPKMKVKHKVDASRFNMEHIRKTAYAGLMTQYRLRLDVYAPQDWNDMNVAERQKKAEAAKRKVKAGSPEYIYYDAVSEAFGDILKNRRKVYEALNSFGKQTER